LLLLRVKFFHTLSVLVAQIAEAPAYRLALPVGLQHSPLLLQLAVDGVTHITLQVAAEILLIAQEALVLLALPGVLPVRNHLLTQAALHLLEFHKAALAQLSTVLLMEQAALVALQIRAGLAGLVLQALFISHGYKTRNM
jgi:hypothetical protein